MYIVILQLLLVFPKSLNLNILSTAACTKKTISSCLSLLLLKLKMPELELENQCDEDRDYSSLRSTSETRRIVLLTKLVRLPITRLSVRAVSFLALHETPAGYFFGTCLASKLCIRTIMQAHSTLRKPANTHHTHSKTKKFMWNTDEGMNEEKVGDMAYCYLLCVSFWLCSTFQIWQGLDSWTYAHSATQDHFYTCTTPKRGVWKRCWR